MDHENFSVEDFCQDLSFWKWVKYEDTESKLFWEKWLEQNPDKKPEVERARKILQAIHVNQQALDNNRLVQLWEDIESNIASSQKIRYLSRPAKRQFVFSRIAAIFVGFIIGFACLYVLTIFNRNEEMPVSQEVEMIERSNPAGSTSTITLPEGTKIRLNAASTLIFPEEFSRETREISLTGEAFFEVAEDASRPFIINTGRFNTTVLGTSFNISAYSSSQEIKVAVVEGKVFVENKEGKGGKNSLTITPKEMAVFNKASGKLNVHTFSYLKEIAWKDNIIHFENADMDEIIDKLAKWYGVTFVLNKRITSNRDYTATYNSKSLEEILEGLSFAFDFKFTIDDKVVTIN